VTDHAGGIRKAGVEVNVIKSVPTEAVKSARREMVVEIRSRILIVSGTVMRLIFMNQVWISGISRNC
jgi:hypothetical protein